MSTIATRLDRTAATVAAELVDALDALATLPGPTICRARIGGERCGIELRRTQAGWYGHVHRPLVRHYPVPAVAARPSSSAATPGTAAAGTVVSSPDLVSESELRAEWGDR